MRFRHKMTGKNTIKRVFSFLLMLCLLVPTLPSSIGLEAKADDTTNTATGDGNTVTIKLHDLYIDRKEALPDNTKLTDYLTASNHARSITVPKGTTLANALTGSNDLLLGTKSLKDTGVYNSGTEDDKAMTSEINASKCIWYTRGDDTDGGIDGNNPRVTFDSTEAINNNIDLYTYSYRLRLITGKQEYKDLIVREGQTSGFISGEGRKTTVDISKFLTDNEVTTNGWKDINTDTAADTSALTGGLTRNYILRANGVEARTQEIDCKVAVNGSWVSAGKISLDLDRVDVWGRTGPALNYYVTDDELQEVYGTYGFGEDITFTKEDKISSTVNGYFPFYNTNYGTLRVRQMPKYETIGEKIQFRVPLVEETGDTKGLAVYYTPHNTTEYDSNFLAYESNRQNGRNRYGWVQLSDYAVLKDNSFYTVDVEKEDATDRQYVLSGGTATVAGKDSTWSAVKWIPNETTPDTYTDAIAKYKINLQSNDDNVTFQDGTFTISQIRQPFIITKNTEGTESPGTMQVRCYVLINKTWTLEDTLKVDKSRWDISWGRDTSKEINTRVYVTSKELESVYGKYGFSAKKYNGELIFPHTDQDGTQIWIDKHPVKDGIDGMYHIPILNRSKNTTDLYYAPNSFTGSDTNKESIKDTNTFYSVDALDEAGTLGDSFTNPETQYFFTGTDATVTLPNTTWYGRDQDGGAVDVTNGTVENSKISITIPKISCATILTTQEPDPNAVVFQAFAVVDGKWQVIKKTTFDKKENLTDDKYYAISAKTLEEIYGSFGFKAKDATKDSLAKQFLSEATHDSTGTIQSNGTATVSDQLCVKTTVKQDDSTKGISLYYVPANTATSCSITDKNVISQNNFYSIEVNNENKKFSDDEIPSKQYFRAGTDVQFTLPTKSGIEWYIKEATIVKDDCFMLTPGETSSVLSISNISTSVVLTAIDNSKSNDNSLKSNEIVSLHCYVIIDGSEKEVRTIYLSSSQYDNIGGNRFYISTKELETVYQEFGFVAADYKNERYFPVTAHDNGTKNVDGDNPTQLWADVLGNPEAGTSYYKIPLLKNAPAKLNVDIVYAPNNKSGTLSYFGEGQTEGKVRTSIRTDNTFYSITAKDEADKFPGVPLPDTQYALTGTDKTITLPYDENVNWYIDSDGSTTKIEPDADSMKDGKATYTLKNVTKSIKLTTDGLADNEVAVSGYISVNGEWKKVSSMKISISQATGKNDNDRYYLTSDDLEKLFGSCGFKAEDYEKTAAKELSKYFPSNTIQPTNESNNDTKLWTDAEGKNTDGTWQVNTIQRKNREKGIAVYYVPNIANIGTGTSFSKTNEKVLADNQFYTISFEDSTGNLNADKIPSTMYRQAGQVKVTLPYAEGITWTAMGKVTVVNSEVSSAATTIQKVNADKTEVELTITVNTSLTVTTDTSVDKNQIKLVSYVAIDGEWQEVDTSLTTLSKLNWDSTIPNGDRTAGRFYITAEELETIYGQYGFEPSDCKVGDANTRLFAVRTKYQQNLNNGQVQGSDNKIWVDQLPKASGGSWYLPLIESGYVQKDQLKNNIVYLYYLPKNRSTEAAYFNASDDYTKATMIKANSFYHIKVEDPDNDFEEKNLPKDQLLLSGTSTTIELPYKDGVTWTVTDENGSLVNLEQTTENGKVKITVPSINSPLIVTTKKATSVNLSDDEVAVNAYVSIDDTWVPVRTEWTYTDGKFVGGSDSFYIKDSQTNNKRYYLTVAQLEEIFGGRYGFSADAFAKDSTKNHFPHSTIQYKDSSSNSIYGDTTPVKVSGQWCIPFIKTDDKNLGISIYYIPKTTGNNWLKTDQTLLSDNCFSYSMSAADPLNIRGNMPLPDAKSFDKNAEASYTLPAAPENTKWVAINKNTGVTITGLNSATNSDGSITYSTEQITQPIQFILTDGQIIVEYTANLEYSDREPLGNLFKEVSRQNIIEDGTVQNEATFAETTDGSSTYTVRAPDSKRVKVRATEGVDGKRPEPRDYYYSFKGWKVEGTDITINPGDNLTKKLGENLAIVKLNAVWEALDNKNRPNTVNFYVSTACEIMDNMSNGFAGQAKSAFTTTIYSTRIYGTDDLSIDPSQTADNGDFQILAPADTASTAYRTDTTLRDSVNTKFTSAAITSGNMLSLESFPTDEEILEGLKERIQNGDEGTKTTVTMDGQEISIDELTTTNFAVRWYVLKYHNSDAWHIDGVLVAKQARAVVTKTFAGDEEAIKAVKENGYSISVTHNHDTNQNTEEHTDYILSLEPSYLEMRQDYVGYTRYDEETDTYTWILTARQNREYTLTERSYKPPDSTGTTYEGSYHYMIENSDTGNTIDWQPYPEETGIKLTAQAYPEDAPEDSYQRVSFRNIYVREGLLTVMKVDAATSRGLGNVAFKISRVDEQPIKVYRKYTMNGKDQVYQNQYKVVRASYDESPDEDREATDLYELVEDNVLKTDGTGLFQVYLPVDSTSDNKSAEYFLQETLPLGYDGPTKLKVTVSDNGKIQQITQVVEPNTELPDGKKWITGENTAMLTINNYSKILTTVTAQKKWDDTIPENERQSVKVELWRNDVKMTDTGTEVYTQTLNTNNNWSYTWKNLPLFVDGEIANYQLREVQINDTKYNLEAGSNGYKDYVVSYDQTKYLQNLDGEENLDTLNPLSPANLEKWNAAGTSPYWEDNDGNRTYAQHALLVVTNSKKPSDIFFKKTDGLGNPLEGALFGMYADADCKQLLSQSKSDANGQVQFVSRAGDMYIKEISAPDGCTLDTTVYKVVTDTSGKKILQKVSDSSSVETIANLSHINLLIQKVDNNDQALTGAEFTIEKLENNTYQLFGQGTYKVNSDDGIVRIVDEQGNLLNFDEGKYRITETKTPGDLYRNAGSIIVTVQGGQVYYEKSNADTDIDSWTMERRANTVIYTLQVVNSPWYALPSTGNFNPSAALAALLGAALMCGASALALWLRKKRGQNTL